MSLSKSEIHLKSLVKIMKQPSLFSLELHQIIVQYTPRESIEDNPWSEKLNILFPKVFQPPIELPPQWPIDHLINIIEGIKLVNVKPYRYSHFQKNKVKWLVQEVLSANLIQPLQSPCANLAWLVKKKDEGWQLCIGYRALNKVTIHNCFPISIIKELLD